jgi:hypothetical protein
MPPERSIDEPEIKVLQFLADFHFVTEEMVRGHLADKEGQDPDSTPAILQSLIVKGFLATDEDEGVVRYWPTRMCGEAMISIVHW